jgi:aspartyl aminopeptidase
MTATTVASSSQYLALAEKARAFLSASTDPFHAVANAVAKLESAGFQKVRYGRNALASNTDNRPNFAPGGKYYYTVHHSTLVAFTIGQQYTQGTGARQAHPAFHVIGGHTDSPNLKVKPRSQKPSKGATSVVQLGVECYGGGLWHTWFDRDLSISGKVLVRETATAASNGAGQGSVVQPTLVKLEDPIARVSTLCIHLQSAEERRAFAVNKEEHTSPTIASTVQNMMEPNEQLEQGAAVQLNGSTGTDSWQKGQEPLLLQRIAKELNIEVSQIADWELSLYDTQPAAIGGMHGEFLYSARLDNLATVFCAVEALTSHSLDLSTSQDVDMIVCFDHEEVGSVSSHGAGSPVMLEAMDRVRDGLGISPDPALHATSIASSFCLSIDQAHAIHPNYASKHEAQHAPVLNGGVVIKTNSNQRYATNGTTSFLLRELAKSCDVPIQEFAVRNDCPCGSTIGPTISALTGLRVVDAGMPQLSMHSCREMMGTKDLTHGVNLFRAFFGNFRKIDQNLSGDE